MTSALQASVFAKVVAAIQSAAYLKYTSVFPETHFQDDLGLDSIDATEVFFHIEEVFQTEFTPEAIGGFRCVADVVDHLSARYFRDANDVECEDADYEDVESDRSEHLARLAA